MFLKVKKSLLLQQKKNLFPESEEKPTTPTEEKSVSESEEKPTTTAEEKSVSSTEDSTEKKDK